MNRSFAYAHDGRETRTRPQPSRPARTQPYRAARAARMQPTRIYRGPHRSAAAADRRHHKRPGILIALAIALAALIAAPVAIGAVARLADSFAVSTPSTDWHQGELPYLYQRDRTWADESYAGGTIADNGCGPTCLAMAAIALTGRTDLSPRDVAAFSEQHGFTADGMTSWSLMSDGAAMLGLRSRELPANASAIAEALAAGHPIICSMGPGDFTTTGHFIVLAGIADDGSLEIRDPNSPLRSMATWDIQRVLDQCKNLWELSV